MHTSNFLLKQAERTDLIELQTLFVNTISTVCAQDYMPEQIRVWTNSIHNRRRWIAKLKSQYFIIILTGDIIVGFASLENNNYLDFLYVHKDYQRQGIAARLYSEIESEAIKRGAHIFFADVSITARPFFEKMEFEVLHKQCIIIDQIEIVNYKMTKLLKQF